VVDGTPISLATLQRELDRMRRAPAPGSGSIVEKGALPASDPEMQVAPGELQKLARALLDPLIDRQILASHARAANLQVREAEVQRATDALAEASRAAGLAFSEHLVQDGQTVEQLSDETRERLLAEKYVARELKVEKPTREELRDWFERHRADFEQPEEVHALQIFVSSAEEAKSLLDQIRKGTPFEEVARASSQSPDARRGGDLGFFPKGTMPKVFDDTCFALRPGQVSGVVPSRYGFHLFKLLERRGARSLTFEQAKAEVERRILEERRIAGERALLAALRANAKVTIDEAALARLR
jgi:peptidyl-prolyl cis-trans isomerase C/foldase protein PrsA